MYPIIGIINIIYCFCSNAKKNRFRNIVVQMCQSIELIERTMHAFHQLAIAIDSMAIRYSVEHTRTFTLGSINVIFRIVDVSFRRLFVHTTIYSFRRITKTILFRIHICLLPKQFTVQLDFHSFSNKHRNIQAFNDCFDGDDDE